MIKLSWHEQRKLYFHILNFSTHTLAPSRQVHNSLLASRIMWGPRWHSGEGAVLQIGKSLVRFQMVLLEFFIDINLPIALWP